MVSENQLNRRIGTTVGLIVIVSATLMACNPTSTGNGADGSTTDLDGTSGDGGGGGADSGEVVEQCNAIDDDDDGLVDEDCPCIDQSTQPCYPAPHPAPDGCGTGTQICSSQQWGACEGADIPPPGLAKCCYILDEQNPIYEVLNQCLSDYPAATIPECLPLSSWDPNAPGCDFANVTANVADEFVDRSAGGITVANVQAGRDHTRGLALADFGINAADVLFENQPPIEIEGQQGCDPGGRAFAWGSILYRTSMGAVGEVVYLYVGICTSNCDAEAFLRSVEPNEVCSEGTVL